MIPRIIHQIWNVEQIPERWLGFQESWRKNHPDYEYRLWTDAANRAFIAENFPELLSVYNGYRHQVSRADLARYLIGYHYGGIYVDLDCESLRPLDDLLDGGKLVFCLEPQTHIDKPAVSSRGFTRIVGNALFACAPRHPFWEHLFPFLIASKNDGNVLEVAGPLVLTRACDSYSRPHEITLLPASTFYPLDHFLKPINDGVNTGRSPYAVHYWAGSWWRSAVLNNARRRIMAARAANAAGEDR